MEINENVINWLIEDDNPPVQYLTLKNLLKKKDDEPALIRAKAMLMDYTVTREILRHADEFWPNEKDAYRKYTGKYWQAIFLGQFLAVGEDAGIKSGVLSLIEQKKWVIQQGGQCLTANLLAAFRRLGFGGHPVVIEETENLASRIVNEKGLDCSAMSYSLLSRCYMAVPKCLLSFAAVPLKERTQSIQTAIDFLADQLIKNEVYIYVPGKRKEWQHVLAKAPKKDDLPKGETVINWIHKEKERFITTKGTGGSDVKSGWLKFGFPLYYNSDILEAVYSLAYAGIAYDPKMEKALQIIKDKKTSNGRWILDNSLNGKMWADVEVKGKESKWITYFALYVQDRFPGQQVNP